MLNISSWKAALYYCCLLSIWHEKLIYKYPFEHWLNHLEFPVQFLQLGHFYYIYTIPFEKKTPKIIWPIQAIFNSVFKIWSNKHMPYHSHSHSHTNIYFMEIYLNFSVQRRKMLTCHISPCCCDVCKHIINTENEKHI